VCQLSNLLPSQILVQRTSEKRKKNAVIRRVIAPSFYYYRVQASTSWQCEKHRTRSRHLNSKWTAAYPNVFSCTRKRSPNVLPGERLIATCANALLACSSRNRRLPVGFWGLDAMPFLAASHKIRPRMAGLCCVTTDRGTGVIKMLSSAKGACRSGRLLTLFIPCVTTDLVCASLTTCILDTSSLSLLS